MSPTAALFDIGNVLVHIDFQRGLSRLLPPACPNPRERLEGLLDKQDELEAGMMAANDFIAWASERLGFEGPPAEFLAAWNDIFEPIHAMWGITAFLKSQGLRLILFSNTNPMHAHWLLENYEVFDDFEGRVFSYEAGANKPDPAIYQHAIQKYDLNPAETLYLDDRAENIAQGEAMGLRCHQYLVAEHHKFIAWLDGQFGIEAN